MTILEKIGWLGISCFYICMGVAALTAVLAIAGVSSPWAPLGWGILGLGSLMVGIISFLLEVMTKK